ncbi:hypothetical protein C2S53_011050 [Perilla frutescens var. hirtella]|uniref:RING-type domain-containing protein n=1 Tax=Perilla frutescens var. hirtella TaxID=608512 RepID=A0AAD4J4I5_PERFH|nr:hypothetical protein C2S53_011050 [Perilla frutescens var. hirtella]
MLPSQIPIDEMFDLDSALTMPDADADEFTDHERQHEDDESKAKAAAGRLLDQMPTVATAEGGSHCAVCTEGLRLAAAAKRIPCGHVFHENCISRWLSVNYSCPLCRQKCPAPGNLSSN